MSILSPARHNEIVAEIVDALRKKYLSGVNVFNLVRYLEEENISDLVINDYFSAAFDIENKIGISCFKRFNPDIGLVELNEKAIDSHFTPMIDAARQRWISAAPYPDLMCRLHREVFRGLAKDLDCYVLVRAANPCSGLFVGRPGYRAAPSNLVALSRTTGPNPGLMAVDPKDERLQAILETLEPPISYEQHVKNLSRYEFEVGTEEEGFVVRDENGTMFYPTYFILGIYSKADGENLWRYPEGEIIRNELNTRFGEVLVDLGAYTTWERLDDISWETHLQPQLPAICFEPSGNATAAMDVEHLRKLSAYWRIRWPFSNE